MTEFAPHGDFTLKIDGRVMHMWSAGATNIEQIEQINAQIDAFLDSLDGGYCGALVEVGEFLMLTADAVEECTGLIRNHMARGLCAVAVIIRAEEYGEFIYGNLRSLYDTVGLTHARFDTIDDARAWLDAQLAKAETACV